MSYLPIIATEMILASAGAIVLYWWDKQAATKNGSRNAKRAHPRGRPGASRHESPPHARISEQTLLLVSLAGGWPGAWWASQRFRHKTKKVSFRIQFWIVMLLHIAGVSAVLWYL